MANTFLLYFFHLSAHHHIMENSTTPVYPAAEDGNAETLVYVSASASGVFLLLFTVGFIVILILFREARRKFKSHHEDVDSKTFDIQHKVSDE